ncbi:protein DpdD [Nocardia sp. NPDC052278]|uniref:protein DpdD n=1 Tax=Nocardia sp. NPDC052278 TaxID=3364328 RepID=UPI0037CBC87D
MTSDETIDRLVDILIGPGNSAWKDQDPESEARSWLQNWLFLKDSDVPYVLPRVEPGSGRRIVYVIPRSTRQTGVVREWLTAFVGPSYAKFVQEPHTFRDGDPIDTAVREFAGHNNVFVLEYPSTLEIHKGIWQALRRMRDTVARRPLSTWSAPTPLGRLLAEFDLAIAAGDNASSAVLLDRLAASGLSGTNHTHLMLKRLSRLGQHGEIMRLPQLNSVVAAGPPAPVREAILGAIYTTTVSIAVESADFAAAQSALSESGELVPTLAQGTIDNFSTPALVVLAIYASMAGDTERLSYFQGIPEFSGLMSGLLLAAPRSNDESVATTRTEDQTAGPANSVSVAQLATQSATAVAPDSGPEDAEICSPGHTTVGPTPVIERAVPGSWLDLVTVIADGTELRAVIGEEPWRGWRPAFEVDSELATALGQLNDIGVERAWSIVGGFIDSDNYRTPAPLTARFFLDNALTHSRFHPGDLAGIVALADIVLRSAPDPVDYRRMLDDLRAEATRWVSVNRASIALDLADLVVRAACPDVEARLRLCTALLRPLSDQHVRLEPDQARIARIVDDELGLGLLWGPLDGDIELSAAATRSVGHLLLYSLDEGVLDRVRVTLSQLVPGVTVTCSHDRVGSPRLKQWSQRADFVAMATRCATHAATGFIRSSTRPRATIREADGSGSASLLRAAMTAIRS